MGLITQLFGEVMERKAQKEKERFESAKALLTTPDLAYTDEGNKLRASAARTLGKMSGLKDEQIDQIFGPQFQEWNQKAQAKKKLPGPLQNLNDKQLQQLQQHVSTMTGGSQPNATPVPNASPVPGAQPRPGLAPQPQQSTPAPQQPPQQGGLPAGAGVNAYARPQGQERPSLFRTVPPPRTEDQEDEAKVRVAGQEEAAREQARVAGHVQQSTADYQLGRRFLQQNYDDGVKFVNSTLQQTVDEFSKGNFTPDQKMKGIQAAQDNAMALRSQLQRQYLGLPKEPNAPTQEWKPTHITLKDGTVIPGFETGPGQYKKLNGEMIDPDSIKDIGDPKTPPVGQENEQLAFDTYAEKHGKPVNQLTAQEKVKAIADMKEATADPDVKAERQLNLQLGRQRLADARSAGTSGLTDDQAKALADNSILTGHTPSFGLGKSQDREKFNRAYANALIADPDAAAARASYKAGTANLTQLTKMRGQVGSVDDMFQLDLANAQQAASEVPRTAFRKVNSVQQLMASNWEDDPQLAAFKVATQTAINQYARLMFSVSGGGTTTDSARAHAEDLLNSAMAKGSYQAALDQMNKEARNRITGLDDEIDRASKSKGLTGHAQSGQTPTVKTKAQFDALPSGATYIGEDGKKYRKP